LSAQYIIFTANFPHFIQSKYIAHGHILQTVYSDKVILRDEQRATCHLCYGIETKLISKFVDCLFSRIIDAVGMNKPKD
jgi:hypothetical protein